MGREEVLVEVHFYNAEGTCLGRMIQWSDYYNPECEQLWKVPKEASYFRVCCANNYSVNIFDRATQGYCPQHHALAAATATERDNAKSITDLEDIRLADEVEAEDNLESEDSENDSSDGPCEGGDSHC